MMSNIFSPGQIWGNLISSLVFSERGDNASISVSYETLQLCGANDCPANNLSANVNLKRPEKSQVSRQVVNAGAFF